MARVWVGTSGWLYETWRSSFYPPGLRQNQVLAYNARQFNSVEVNGTFYCLQKPATFERWYQETPAGFLFAIKGSRFITHNKKLLGAETALANFFAQGLLRLEDKLGPIVWQLPANARFDGERLRSFLSLLPRDSAAAAELARRHDHRVEGRSWTRTACRRPLRHALEIRGPTFFVPELVRIARDLKVALVISDAAGWQATEEITAGFVYIRLHGALKTYASAYDRAALEWWARRIELWRAGKEPADARRITDRKPPARRSRDVYVYFDNDNEANAPHDALNLAHRLGLQGGEESEPCTPI